MLPEDILPDVIEWNEGYKVGVESIDHAHQELFTIVHRLHKLLSQTHRDKWACEQGIKYLKNYTVRHFADEEAYMEAIGFIGRSEHKLEHDKMRDEVIPRMEQHLEEDDYSPAAIQRFLNVCFLWLDKHIINKDRMIGRY